MHVRMLEMNSAPVTEKEVRMATRRDPILSKLLCCVLKGWAASCDAYPELAVFKAHADELSTESGCVLWGSRVLVPGALQERVLKMLHEAHPGMSRMKALARCYVWWPGMDKQIEALVKGVGGVQVKKYMLILYERVFNWLQTAFYKML